MVVKETFFSELLILYIVQVFNILIYRFLYNIVQVFNILIYLCFFILYIVQVF